MSRRIQLIERLRRLQTSLAAHPEHAQGLDEIVALVDALGDEARAKDEFLAVLGHELRNGLSPILAAIQLRKSEGEPFGRELTILEHHAWQLARLADDLLDLSLLAQRRLTLERGVVSIQDVLARALEVAAPLVSQRRHVLKAPPRDREELAYADRGRLIQAFGNLLTNAAKYTPAAGTIELELEGDADAVTVRIRDSGVGIARRDLSRVFELFSRGEHGQGAAGAGLGVGLAIVRGIIELHSGSVQVESGGPGCGTTFTVTLPRALGTEPVAARASASAVSSDDAGAGASELAGARVLVVDDNEDTAELLAEILVQRGCEVRTAADGETALELAKSFRPRLVLLDLGLPSMDGYEVARRLRRAPSSDGVTLIAFTGYGQKSDRERTREAGFDAHVVKPFDVSRLLELLAASMR